MPDLAGHLASAGLAWRNAPIEDFADTVAAKYPMYVVRGLGGVLVDLTSARATFVIGGSGVLLVALVAVGLFRGVGRGPVDA